MLAFFAGFEYDKGDRSPYRSVLIIDPEFVVWRAVPTPRDSAVANQLIGLEDWGGNISLGVGNLRRLRRV